MRNRKGSSALVIAGAAAAAGVAAWLGRRGLRQAAATEGRRDTLPSPQVQPAPRDGELIDIDPSYDRLVERDSEELPIGRSADPEIDSALWRTSPGRDETSGASLFGEAEERPRKGRDEALDEIWNAAPGFAEGEQTEGYDAVTPEELGSVWLERATQTTHVERAHASDPSEIPDIDDLWASEPRTSSVPPGEADEEIADDELDFGDMEPPGEQRVSSR